MENYTKEQIVGRGAYGTVFLCRRKDGGKNAQTCILKEIPMETMSQEERESARNEVEILKVLNHPNIVRYIDSEFQSRAIVIVMEYVTGGTLFDFIQRQKDEYIPEDKIISLFVQITVALSHIHSKNILHRDLKTQNLLIDRHHQVVKISDFGISKVLNSKSKALTVVGTPCYISPEVCDKSPYNQKSDIWALGCILYELCMLKRAFEAASLPALVMKIMRANYDPPAPIFSDNLRRIISKCLSLEPHRRPTTSQLLCEPILFSSMLPLYASIGAYVPSSNKRKAKNSSAQSSLIKSHVRSSRVFLWGDGHLTPRELPVPNDVGVINNVLISGGVRVGTTDQDIVLAWDASVSANGLAQYEPRRIGKSRFRDVAAGQGFLSAITDRGVLVVAKAPDFDPQIVESFLGMDCTQVSAGPRHVIALTAEGEVWCVFNEKLTDITAVKHLKPELCPLDKNLNTPARNIFSGPGSSAAITETGRLFVRGRNVENRLMLDRPSSMVNSAECFTEVKLDFPVKSITIGENHSAVISTHGNLYLVGSNKHGALGDSFSSSRSVVFRELACPVSQVAVGIAYTCALCQDGTVWTWGRAIRGQLGRNPEPADSPRRVDIDNAISVSSSDGITLVAKNEHEHVLSFFVQLCVDIANIDMHAVNDEDQENDPEIQGNSYAIEFVLEALAIMMSTRSAAIRSYSCDLIGKLLVEIPQEYELTLPVISNMTEALVTRANDQSASVRLLALDALNRLQDYRNRDCPVIAQYLRTMKSDTSAENRAMAVKRCSLNKETLLDTIDRCLDEDLRVRKEALKKIAGKVKHHVLTDVQVLSLLKHGLDDEPEVRDVVVNNLIPSWLTHIRKCGRKNEKGNLIDLVMSLDPSSTDGTSFETSRATIEVVFDQWESLEGLVQNYCQASERLVTCNMLPNINEENCGPAVAFTWFHFVQRAVKLGDAEAYMPQFPDFCDLIEERARMIVHIRTELEESDAYFENRQEFAGDTVRLEDHLFEIKWLIKALPFFDISLDPMNREKLKSLLKYIVVQMFPEDLQELSESLGILVSEVARAEKQRKNDTVKELVEVLREEGAPKNDSQPTDDESQPNTQITDEQLEELRNEIGEVQMRIHQLENQQRDAIEEKNFSEASRIEEEIKPHKTELQELQIRKNQTKRLPSTINSEDDNTEHRFTYSSAQKALILLNGHMSRLKTLELGLDQFVKILVVPVLMKISMGEITGDKKQPALLEEQAIKCLGLICSLNLSTAKEYFAILVVIAQNEANNVGAMARQAAIQSVIDLALIYDHELTKDLDTTQLESILQSTANESTWGDTAINATTVVEDGPQTTCAKLLIGVLRERETEENKQAREISIDGLVSIQLAHRAPSAALQLQVLLHICSKEYHGHDMTDYQKAMMRIVLNEEAFKMLENTLRLALNHIISNQDNLVDLDGASAERILPLIFKLANPEAFHKASEERTNNHIIDIIKVPLSLVMVILEVVKDHFMTGVTWGILKLCTDIDISLPLKEICDENKFEQTLPLREEIYRIYEKAIEIKPLIKERHAQDAIKGLISSFDKQVRLCAAVEENERNKIEAAKKIAEEKEKDEQELEKEKKDKLRKSKTARKSSDKTVEEEIQEGVEQMTLPAEEEEEDKDDAGASSSGAEQPVPAKKAKKTPPAKKRSSQRSKSSQSGNTSTDMESPKIIPKTRRSKRTRRNDSQESS